MLLFVRQEGCNTLCNVLFDVIVEERVVIAVEAFRPEYLFQELRDCIEVEFGMRQNHTAIDDHLCIRSDITDLRLTGFPELSLRINGSLCNTVITIIRRSRSRKEA